MKCIILSAGYGTRLGTLTKDRPKPMIEVGGRPVIEHIITRLNIHGIHDIIVNLHYLPGIVSEYLGNRVIYFYEPRLLGHHGTLMALKNWLLPDDRFMVINGDTITDVNYTSMMEFHEVKTITAYMDDWRSAGTWIYDASYFTNSDLSVRPYREHCFWADVGTPDRLEAARRYFDEPKTVNSMPSL